jgi:hypothetical protein
MRSTDSRERAAESRGSCPSVVGPDGLEGTTPIRSCGGWRQPRVAGLAVEALFVREERIAISAIPLVRQQGARMTKYEALTTYLASRKEASLVLTFVELPVIVDLPPSAMKHPAWWANSRTAQCHAAAWLDAGFNARPDFNARTVRLQRGSDQGRPGFGGGKRPRGLR